MNNSLQTILQESRTAQEQWKKLSISERILFFSDLRDEIVKAREEIAQSLAKENGKPMVEALTTEVVTTLDLIRYYEKNCRKILNPKKIKLGLMKHRVSRLEYSPMGVLAIISPWNYPFLLPMGEIVPGLLAGNSVIFKPSEVTPGIGLLIQSLFDRAGFPKGLLQTLIGGRDLGQALVQSRPDKIFFTGSVDTGRKVMAEAAKSLTPVNLELGGKDAMIVLEDADLDLASSAAVWGAFSNSGQVCASVERLLVHQSIVSEFSQQVKMKAQKLRAGDSLSTETDLGSITYDAQKAVYERQILEARAQGADFQFGGSFSDDRRQLEPTLISGDQVETLQVYQEESFGPLVAMTTFSSDDEAIQKTNASKYGLLASVFSKSLDRARKIASRLEVGTVTINEVLYTAGVAETPWGGIKDSGIGRSHGSFGLLEAVHVRHIHEPRFDWLQFKSFWWFPYSRAQYELFNRLTLFYSRSTWTKVTSLVGFLRAFARFLKEPRT